jgi:hypothetical protein
MKKVLYEYDSSLARKGEDETTPCLDPWLWPIVGKWNTRQTGNHARCGCARQQPVGSWAPFLCFDISGKNRHNYNPKRPLTIPKRESAEFRKDDCNADWESSRSGILGTGT